MMLQKNGEEPGVQDQDRPKASKNVTRTPKRKENDRTKVAVSLPKEWDQHRLLGPGRFGGGTQDASQCGYVAAPPTENTGLATSTETMYTGTSGLQQAPHANIKDTTAAKHNMAVREEDDEEIKESPLPAQEAQNLPTQSETGHAESPKRKTTVRGRSPTKKYPCQASTHR